MQCPHTAILPAQRTHIRDTLRHEQAAQRSVAACECLRHAAALSQLRAPVLRTCDEESSFSVTTLLALLMKLLPPTVPPGMPGPIPGAIPGIIPGIMPGIIPAQAHAWECAHA
jgi:hypothetical protein